MDYVIDFVGVGAAVLVSMGLALGLEWLSLRGLMLLMPHTPAPTAVANERGVGRTEQRKAA
jgi:hypothetical protein